MILKLIIILAISAGAAWWLSGFDSKLTGQDRTADLVRRGLRCGVTLLLVGFGSWMFLSGGITGGFIFVLVLLPLAVIWVGCLSECSAHLFHGLVDPTDDRQFDPGQTARDMKRLAGLVRESCYEEAIACCQQLMESNEVSSVAMETMLLHLYEEQFSDEKVASQPAFEEVRRLSDQTNFAAAVTTLENILKKESGNLFAGLFLLRLQSQTLNRSDLAEARLQTLVKESRLPPCFADYARLRIKEWSGILPRREKTSEGIESLLADSSVSAVQKQPVVTNAASADELLAAGHLATAIELLEAKVRDRPDDFESRLKLAEAHGVYCRDLGRARILVDKIAVNPAFSSEQIQKARAELKKWSAASGR